MQTSAPWIMIRPYVTLVQSRLAADDQVRWGNFAKVRWSEKYKLLFRMFGQSQRNVTNVCICMHRQLCTYKVDTCRLVMVGGKGTGSMNVFFIIIIIQLFNTGCWVVCRIMFVRNLCLFISRVSHFLRWKYNLLQFQLYITFATISLSVTSLPCY